MVYPRETVTHPSTNQTLCIDLFRVTSLIETNANTITKPNYRNVCVIKNYVIPYALSILGDYSRRFRGVCNVKYTAVALDRALDFILACALWIYNRLGPN